MGDKFEVGEDGIYEIFQEDKHWSSCKLVIPKETFIEAYNKYIVKSDDDPEDKLWIQEPHQKL